MREQRFQLAASLSQDADRFDHAGGCDFQPATVIQPAVGEGQDVDALTGQQVAARLQVSLRTVLRLADARQIRRVPGLVNRYSVRSVEVFAHGSTVARRRA